MKTRLTHTTGIQEKRVLGKTLIYQQLEIIVDYNPEKGLLDLHAINLYENKKFVAEISTLLLQVKGYPITAMLEAIDWGRLYNNEKIERASFFARFKGLFNFLQKSAI